MDDWKEGVVVGNPWIRECWWGFVDFEGVGTGVIFVGDERTDSMLIIATCNEDILGTRSCEAAAW